MATSYTPRIGSIATSSGPSPSPRSLPWVSHGVGFRWCADSGTLPEAPATARPAIESRNREGGARMGSPVSDNPAVRSAIDLYAAWIESQLAYSGVPALSAAIVHDQELVWARGFGLAHVERQEPATPDTLYRIASITKLFTATALLQLRDAGKLRLDDPLTTHLPWFAIQRAQADAEPITIRHLLTHAAGLPREAAFPYWADGQFPTTAEIRAALGGQRPPLAPGVRWKYSNLGLTLAGEIVAAASGQAYAAYVRERILEPLGMRETLVESPAADHPRLAAGYTRRLPDGAPRQRAPHTDTRGLTPAANITTSVR